MIPANSILAKQLSSLNKICFLRIFSQHQSPSAMRANSNSVIQRNYFPILSPDCSSFNNEKFCDQIVVPVRTLPLCRCRHLCLSLSHPLSLSHCLSVCGLALYSLSFSLVLLHSLLDYLPISLSSLFPLSDSLLISALSISLSVSLSLPVSSPLFLGPLLAFSLFCMSVCLSLWVSGCQCVSLCLYGVRWMRLISSQCFVSAFGPRGNFQHIQRIILLPLPLTIKFTNPSALSFSLCQNVSDP